MARSRTARFGTLHLLTKFGVAVAAGLLAAAVASEGHPVRAAGFMMVAAGAGLNLIVICANGGRMPADTLGRPAYVGSTARTDGYVLMNGRTRLRYLGDWIGVGRRLLSPGDLCLYAGAATALVSGLFFRH